MILTNFINVQQRQQVAQSLHGESLLLMQHPMKLAIPFIKRAHSAAHKSQTRLRWSGRRRARETEREGWRKMRGDAFTGHATNTKRIA